jgi:tRNA(Arg) A34 adenosine deaminase TadA
MDHEKYMKRCYELAVQAGKKGFDTFGAVLVHDGKILEEAENTADWEKGIFGHAEFNLVHKCANRFSDHVLKASTLYTSCAPCERCLCAIASSGVENVVFGVSYEAFSQLTPHDAVPLDREGLLQQLGIRMKLTGPVLEEEGMHVFEWWGGEYRPLAELISEMAEIRAGSAAGSDTNKKQ